jgi:hypothetical protein
MNYKAIRRLLFVISGMFGTTAAGASAQTADATTINNKVLAGYQGWFRTPGDVTKTNTFAHWFSGAASQSTEAFDMWPDLSTFPANAVYTIPNWAMGDGTPATLYSGQNPAATLRHFQMMRDEGIDGVFLSEFSTHFATAGGSNAGDYPYVLNILNNVRAAATATGRTWAFFYDTSGASSTNVVSVVEGQWQDMVNSGYTSDPRYLHQNGLPVIMIYGFFPNDTNHVIGNPTLGNQLIQFFTTPGPYQAYIVGSGAWYWRTQGNAAFQNMISGLNAYIPWNVGHDSTLANGTIVAQTYTYAADAAALAPYHVKFIPLVFPGTTSAGPPVATQTAPRRDGDFYWEQFAGLSQSGFNTNFVAMWDEVNEATAIMPVSNIPPVQTPEFYTQDGYPADWYERLTAVGQYYMANNLPVPSTIPISPGPVVLSVSATASGLAYSRVSQTFNGTVTVTNTSSSPVFGPFQLLLSSLTNGVTVENASGTYQGSPYLTVPYVVNLGPGQSTTLNVQFSDKSMASINFTPVVYGGSF